VSERRGPRVALTFDAEHPDRPACPPGVQDEMVTVLDDLGVRATFFLQGRWVEAYPNIARRIAEAGHLIGNHSFYHARMPLLADAGRLADIGAAERAIADATGAVPRPWFRCPFDAGANEPRVLDALERMGYRNVGWNVEPREWEAGRTAADVEASIVQGVVGHGDGAVVLLHAWPEPTLRALPRSIARLRALGVDFVTVADLIPARGEPGP
jgi:peptidoglycan-N-acetylglucosamine deacetylase